jgi:hypothetical protein
MTNLLGWAVIPQVVVRRERWSARYTTRSVPLVQPGQSVQPDQPVIRTERVRTPAELAGGVPRFVLPGVANSHARPGVAADAQDGSEFLPAGLRGTVVALSPRGGVVIESRAALLQGVIGAGEQVAGILTMWQGGGGSELQAIPPAALLVVPGPLNLSLLHRAMASGVSGVIASSISSRDLEGFLRTDLIELIGSVNVEAAQSQLPPLTLLFTEGLGIMAMPAHILDLLSRHQGSIALLAGATSVRQGVFPELVIPLAAGEGGGQDWQALEQDLTITPGAHVRISSGAYEGATGTVIYLFAHQQAFLSGVTARAIHLLLENGTTATVPITLVERIS